MSTDKVSQKCVVVDQRLDSVVEIEINCTCSGSHENGSAAVEEKPAAWGLGLTISVSLGLGLLVGAVIAAAGWMSDGRLDWRLCAGASILAPSLANGVASAVTQASDVKQGSRSMKIAICVRDISKGMMIAGGLMAAFLVAANIK